MRNDTRDKLQAIRKEMDDAVFIKDPKVVAWLDRVIEILLDDKERDDRGAPDERA